MPSLTYNIAKVPGNPVLEVNWHSESPCMFLCYEDTLGKAAVPSAAATLLRVRIAHPLAIESNASIRHHLPNFNGSIVYRLKACR